MNLVVCVDERMGMMFHRRRQSRDQGLIKNLLEMCGGRKLWIAPESEKLMAEAGVKVSVAEDFFCKAGKGEYCLIETWPEQISEKFCENYVEKLILYHWNRHYPADQYFPLDLRKWRLEAEEEFAGTSHETIRKEIYGKNKET